MRVFISHSSKDKPAVEQLAIQLHNRGFDPWFDAWEIGAGDDIVAKINDGLDQCPAGIIVFSEHTQSSRWVGAEMSTLIYERIESGKILIPVMASDSAPVPPLLRPLLRRNITEIDAIEDALRQRRRGPPPRKPPEQGRLEKVLVDLHQDTSGQIRTTVTIRTDPPRETTLPGLSPSLRNIHLDFLRGFRAGIRRSPAQANQAAHEATLAELGRELRTLCLPGGSGKAIQDLFDNSPIGTTIEVCFQANDPDLLALPFEALRLPDDRLLATQPAAVILRRPANLTTEDRDPLAGPLKILIAVGAPDENHTASAVLDLERELQNILDAVEPAQRLENVEVRILEVGHANAIGEALKEDAYHVLHLSGHGLPGAIELEDEDGRAVRTTAAELIEPLRRAGRPLPMVLLNSCHGGVHDGSAASFAESLLRAGVPCVLAMQTSVTDVYATELAREFYANLATRRELLLPSRALADARKKLEAERLKAVQRGEHQAPEYATATLFVAGEDRRIAEFGADKQPLQHRPQYDSSGPVPQLRLGDLIGRRKEVRETLRVLRDTSRRYTGVALTGIGGVGKSTVAGRVIQRLIETDWLIAEHVGRFDLGKIASSLGTALFRTRKLGRDLLTPDLPDQLRLQLVLQVLAEEQVLLVLDDFEQNLNVGGGEFKNAAIASYLQALASAAKRGRLLITCRYPVPDCKEYLHEIAIGELSLAETRKLLLRLEGLSTLDSAALTSILKKVGGHPRVLELLDALLRSGRGRFPHVTRKLEALLSEEERKGASSLSLALLAATRDVFLDELVELVRIDGFAEHLFQTAASNLPLTARDLARMLDENGGDVPLSQRALSRLRELSLVHVTDGASTLHRWTKEGLTRYSSQELRKEYANRAGRFRVWRVQHESQDLTDAIEAVRNFLEGQDFEMAADVAKGCFEFFHRSQQSVAVAALASEVLESLSESHGSFALIADQEAMAHLAIGLTDLAFERYRQLLSIGEWLARSEPDRADYQRDLSIWYERIGDLQHALGQREQAGESYRKSLSIRERLAQAEPHRADYQRDLSASYDRIGDLYGALGQGEQAGESYRKSLGIRERLAQAEPLRADYQRDLSVSYNRVGDIYGALGQGEQAGESYRKSLTIAERLAQAEPLRADYQRDLSTSFIKVGDMYGALGQGEQAGESYRKSVAIAERLAQAEPDRADYQRDLSVAYNKVGESYRVLGQGEQAGESYRKSLAIAERLAQAEPDRADYQRDFASSLYFLSLVDKPNSRILLTRSRSILQTLKDTGRLALTDEPFLQKLENLLK